MGYLIENADENCEKFKPNHEYPPWQAAPQAGSKTIHERKRLKRGGRPGGTSLPADADAGHANLLFFRGFPRGAKPGQG
jgi:hypothetical protein